MQKRKKSKQKEHAKENDENHNPQNRPDRSHTHHAEAQQKSQSGKSSVAPITTSGARTSCAKGSRTELKRGEPDGLPTPRVSSTRASAHTTSAVDASSSNRTSRHSPKQHLATPQSISNPAGGSTKSESVINTGSSPRPEKSRKGRTVSHQPTTTCSSSANLATSSLVSQRSNSAQSHHQVNGHQPQQHQRTNKSPPHSQQPHGQTSQNQHPQQHQSARANASNKTSTSSNKPTHAPSIAANARSDHRPMENGSSAQSNHINHVQTPNQQHLSNSSNTTKKGKRAAASMVNGSPLPSLPTTSPVQPNSRHQQGHQNAHQGQGRPEGQQQNNVLTARRDQGHCPNMAMVNGNALTNAEMLHQPSPADKRQTKLPQPAAVNSQKDAKAKLDEKISRAAEQVGIFRITAVQ